MNTNSRTGRRPNLLLGTAVAALAACFTATPGAAQNLDAEGAQIIASHQVQFDSPTRAVAQDIVIEAAAAPSGSSITLKDNAVSTLARGNAVASTLAPDALDLQADMSGTRLATRSFGIDAGSPALIASLQTTDHAPTSSQVKGSHLSAVLGVVEQSEVTVSANTQESMAQANEGQSKIALTGVSGPGAAGIATRQSVGRKADVSASLDGATQVDIAYSDGSSIAVDDNLQRALGYGNAAANRLTSDSTTMWLGGGFEMPSVVEADGTPVVTAALAVLSDQTTRSAVSAKAEGGFVIEGHGDTNTTSISASDNGLQAGAYANQSANSLDVMAGTFDTGFGLNAAANVTNVQRADSAVRAQVQGAASIVVGDDAAKTHLVADRNSVQSTATANRADGNLLTVRATYLATGAGGPEDPGVEQVGTALLDHSGAIRVTAPLSVQNFQSFNAPVTASARGSRASIGIKGAVDSASASASGSQARVAATGNSGLNGLALEAVSLAGAADVNSAQFASGDIRTVLGAGHDRAGAMIAIENEVRGSRMLVSANSLAGSAAANSVSNSLAVVANQIHSSSGHDDARAGALDGGIGAAADYALANSQTLGDGHGVKVSTGVSGSFGAVGGAVSGSSLAVEENSQSSAAIGNIARSTLAIEATSLGGDYERAPGSALSSVQEGRAKVEAVSDLKLKLADGATDSFLSVSGNSNSAYAGINDGQNSMEIDAVRIGALSQGDAIVQAEPWLPPQATGDHVLVSNQMAAGMVSAAASTRLGAHPSGGSLDNSSFRAEHNETYAAAVSNEAGNALSLTAASGNEASAAILNRQDNSAVVLADAVTDLRYKGEGVFSSQILLDGNATQALAKGNSAANRLTRTGSPQQSGSEGPMLLTGGLDHAITTSASAVLYNAQSNEGGVSARATNVTYGTALNDYGAYASSILLNGNTSAASAYGNTAQNAISLTSLGALPTAVVTNVQDNSGPVSAKLIGATFRSVPGTLAASSMTVDGNIVSASAVGNLANNAIIAAR